jgi:hypothetical protein
MQAKDQVRKEKCGKGDQDGQVFAIDIGCTKEGYACKGREIGPVGHETHKSTGNYGRDDKNETWRNDFIFHQERIRCVAQKYHFLEHRPRGLGSIFNKF